MCLDPDSLSSALACPLDLGSLPPSLLPHLCGFGPQHTPR